MKPCYSDTVTNQHSNIDNILSPPACFTCQNTPVDVEVVLIPERSVAVNHLVYQNTLLQHQYFFF